MFRLLYRLLAGLAALVHDRSILSAIAKSLPRSLRDGLAANRALAATLTLGR